MKTWRAILAGVIVAGIVGGVAFADRETRIQECRRAAVSASLPVYELASETAERGLAVAREMDREKVAQCYRDGLLATPTG